MLMPVNKLPPAEEQAFAELSDEDFFARFPEVTHRLRPWAPCLAVQRDWMILSRRDGMRMRVRHPNGPFSLPEMVILNHEPRPGTLSFDHGPQCGITGAARHAR